MRAYFMTTIWDRIDSFSIHILPTISIDYDPFGWQLNIAWLCFYFIISKQKGGWL